MGRKIFDDDGWEDYNYWVRENRKIAEKIYKLLNDTLSAMERQKELENLND